MNNLIIWEKYILENLERCFELCTKGLVFNIQISNRKKIQNKIFYTTKKEMLSSLNSIFKEVVFYQSNYLKNEGIFLIKK